MTTAVGAKATVVGSAGVVNLVTFSTCLIKFKPMTGQPVRVAMRFRFLTLFDSDRRGTLTFFDNFRDRVTDIALQPDGLPLSRGMITVMAAETAGEVAMANVIGVSLPSDESRENSRSS
jgi:hypothetical protein